MVGEVALWGTEEEEFCDTAGEDGRAGVGHFRELKERGSVRGCGVGAGVGVGVARSRDNEQGVGVGVGVDQTASALTPERFVLICDIIRLCRGEFACTFWT